MEDFKKEVKEMTTEEIMLILEDQLDLYSDEEIKIMKEELNNRPKLNKEKADFVSSILEKQAYNDEMKKKKEEDIQVAKQIREEQERIKQIKQDKINNLKNQNYEGYYEYETVILNDNMGGGISHTSVNNMLNEMAMQGWKLNTAYINELGHNSSSSGAYGFSTGTNSTIDQHIFIFERFIKF